MKILNRRKTLLIASIALVLAGCGASTQLVAATTTSGHQYPYCLEVTYPVLSLQADVVFCGTITAVQSEQAHLSKLYPQAKLAVVKGLPVEIERK
jgi:starvation-inducible outer membrane lipoprotein